jgi:hypothetical protein
MNNMLVLFAPKFKEFGVDIFNELLRKCPGIKIGGVCTGGNTVVNHVKNNIKNDLLCLDDIEELEIQWLSVPDSEIDYEYLADIDKRYGYGVVGEVITADRRVGLGLVRGGGTRPDRVGDEIFNNPSKSIQKYIQGLFRYLEGLLDKYKFESVFCYAVAGAPAVAIALICKAKSIKFTRFSVTRIGDGFIIDSDYKGRLAPISERFYSNELLDKEYIDKAEVFLENYRNKPVNPDYMNYSHAIIKKNKLLPLSIKIAIYALALIFKPLLLSNYRDRISLIGFKRKAFELLEEWRKVRFDHSIFDNDIPTTKYLYYPLHVDPEASTMVMSPMHTDQLSVIEALSKSLPGDMILVVKEHLPMLGKRPKRFYEQIKRMPRVKLVSPSINAHDLINSSEGVAVITGTAAFEAVLLGKKAIVIGDSPYLSIKSGLIYQPCLYSLPSTIRKLNDSKYPNDIELVRFIACCFIESFSMNSSFLWGKYSTHKIDELKLAIDCIVSHIIKMIDNEAH